MPRISLFHSIMGVAFVAIMLAFSQAEGWGIRYTMIETLSFSSDGSRIAVTKLAARNAETPLKHYKANISRTVCWLNISDGQSGRIVHQDFKPGNSGPAFKLWWLGRTSVLSNPSNDQLAMSSFGGGDVVTGIGTSRPTELPLHYEACNIAYSKSGRFLAASGMYQVTVFDSRDNTVVMEIQSEDLAFLGSSLMAFTDDDTRIVVAGFSGIHVWEIAGSKQISTVIQGEEPSVEAIAVAPDDTLIVCSHDWIRRYDLAGRLVATIASRGARLCCVAPNGTSLAAYGDSGVAIYDLILNKSTRTFSNDGATALSLTSDGRMMAVGDFNGDVSLIETKTGRTRWRVNPPARYRWPWTLPAACLGGWAYVAWRLSRRDRPTVHPQDSTRS